MRELEYSSIDQLLDRFEYSPIYKVCWNFFNIFPISCKQSFAVLPVPCALGFYVFIPFQGHQSSWASKLLYSFMIIHWCRRCRPRFVSIIILLSLFHTLSLPAIIHLHPQNLVPYFSPCSFLHHSQLK